MPLLAAALLVDADIQMTCLVRVGLDGVLAVTDACFLVNPWHFLFLHSGFSFSYLKRPPRHAATVEGV